MYHVATAVQRHQVKALVSVYRISASCPRFERFVAQAYLASNVARYFRRRYDNPEFIESLEKPFEWTDPAEVYSFYVSSISFASAHMIHPS